MAQDLPPKDGLEEYLANTLEGYAGESPPESVWDNILADIPPAVPMAPVAGTGAVTRIAAWIWAGSVAATLIIGTLLYLLVAVNQKVEILAQQLEDQRKDSLPATASVQVAEQPAPGQSQPATLRAVTGPAAASTLTGGDVMRLTPASVSATDVLTAHNTSAAPLQPEVPEIVATIAPPAQAAHKPAVLALSPTRTPLLAENKTTRAAWLDSLSSAPPAAPKGWSLKISTASRHVINPHKGVPGDSMGPRPAFAPERILLAQDYRIGAGVHLRERHLLSFETGLWWQHRTEVAEHTPRLRFRPGPGNPANSQVDYELVTKGGTESVSVTLTKTQTNIPENTPVKLSVITRQETQSVTVPLLARLRTPTYPVQASLRAGVLATCLVKRTLEIQSVASNSPEFAVNSETRPVIEPISRDPLQLEYLLGAGVTWYPAPRVSVSAEPFVQFQRLTETPYPHPRHQELLMAGMELGLSYHF
ncbi:MAG: hypothetical protein SF053_12190 [Bacteroidia bacterium]|nr:hypothetical protein [Bacteroidia bacterium]